MVGSCKAKRIGVFGGTFDPIHVGHLIVAVEIKFALDLDEMLFVPAGHPPHKPDQLLSSNKDRLQMLKLALAGLPDVRISTVDLDRPGPSYTADTLEQLALQFEGDRLYFIMGADSLRDLPDWHAPDRIVSAAELAVATRPDVEIDLAEIARRIPALTDRVHMVDTPMIGISASVIRARVARGEPITFQVPKEVEKYILSLNLYRESAASDHVFVQE